MHFKLIEENPDGDNSPKLSPVELELQANGGVVEEFSHLEYYVEKGGLGIGALEMKYGQYDKSIRSRNNGDPQKCQWELRNMIDIGIISLYADKIENTFVENVDLPKSLLPWLYVLDFAMVDYLQGSIDPKPEIRDALLKKYNDFHKLVSCSEQGRKLLGMLEYRRETTGREDPNNLDKRSGKQERELLG